MKFIYLANILVAGWISLVSIANPTLASRTIFSNAYESTEVIRLVGCLWLTIALMSGAGIFKPNQFALVFVIQLVYKGSWLLFVGLPAIIKGKPYPGGMAIFFLVWVIILPFIIPWKTLID